MDLLLHAIEDSTSMYMIYYLHTGEFIIKTITKRVTVNI